VATRDGPDDGTGAPAAPGAVRVRLEPVEGFFIEGFEIGLRFETGAGERIAATLWTDFVATTGRDDLEAFYDSVLVQEVPAGDVRLLAQVEIGMGPGPSIPDVDGPLPCSLELDVPAGGSVEVEVSFEGGDGCLRLVAPGGAGPDPATDPTAPTSGSVPTTSVPEPAPSLEVGSSTYVDVDLECEAFVLGGTWVLAEGDLSTWQPPGERHEGGMFTIERPGSGRFVGDVEGTKTATFRLLGPNEGAPPCLPVPRPGG